MIGITTACTGASQAGRRRLMFDHHGQETLQRAVDHAVNHHRAVLLPVFADIGQESNFSGI